MIYKVGQTVWIAPFQPGSFYKTGFDAKITKIGHKYVYAGNRGRYKFHIESGLEVSEYTPSIQLWLTRAEYEDFITKNKLWADIRQSVNRRSPPAEISSQDMREILLRLESKLNPQT